MPEAGSELLAGTGLEVIVIITKGIPNYIDDE